ncbi:MAG: hypothetical protein FJ333_04835 [Sphingomonadales bacterium]|nr:hypothetical protein [Sphingomonadales bacterium]
MNWDKNLWNKFWRVRERERYLKVDADNEYAVFLLMELLINCKEECPSSRHMKHSELGQELAEQVLERETERGREREKLR